MHCSLCSKLPKVNGGWTKGHANSQINTENANMQNDLEMIVHAFYSEINLFTLRWFGRAFYNAVLFQGKNWAYDCLPAIALFDET